MAAFLVILFAFAIVYAVFARPRIRVYRHVAGVQDKIDSGLAAGVELILERLKGFKTVIFSVLAGVTPALPQIFDQLRAFAGWSAFVDQPTANKLAAAFAILSMMTHAIGVESAAKAVPKE